MMISAIQIMLLCANLAAAPVDSGYASVNGTRLYYEIAGRGEPVVLIHGNFGDHRHWDAQFREFDKHSRVLRYDVRGFGKSALPVEAQPYAHYQDLAALLRYLKVGPAHIMGVSMGSYIATDFVLMHPEMSRSLVVVGPWVSGYKSTSPEIQSMFDAFGAVAKAFASGKDAALAAWDSSAFWRATMPDATARAKFDAIARGYSFWHYAHNDPETVIEPRTVTQLSKISVPTLVLTADHDAMREVADLLAKSIPNAREVVMRDAGHMMQMQKPKQFNRIVLEFLSHDVAKQKAFRPARQLRHTLPRPVSHQAAS